MVCVAPSTRRLIVTGAALAAGAATAAIARAVRSEPRMRLVMWPPFLEGRLGRPGARSPGLGLNAAPSRGAVRHPSGISDASAPVHSGGTAPASPPASLPPPPVNGHTIPPPPNTHPPAAHLLGGRTPPPPARN